MRSVRTTCRALFLWKLEVICHIICNERNAQKEKNMKLDSNNRSSYRADYEQFSKFLRGSQTERNDNCISHDKVQCHCNGNRPIAMVYCEEQEWQKLFDIEIGLSKGTIFEELDLPLLSTSCGKGGCMGW